MAPVNTAEPIITLTTDFGTSDNYAGIVKGIILSICRKANIVDITNSVPAFDIIAGRYLMETSYRAFPPGTIHVAVVDPGVGTKRKGVVIETAKYYFAGPDNGLFSFLTRREIRKGIEIKNPKYILPAASDTFHARDIFAPAAAYLALGVIPEEFGPGLNDIIRIKPPGYRKTKQGTAGTVIYIDHFGNLVSSIKAERIDTGGVIFLNGVKIGRIKKTFGAVRPSHLVAYINSFGYLEIAVNGGSAREYFHIEKPESAQILIAPISI